MLHFLTSAVSFYLTVVLCLVGVVLVECDRDSRTDDKQFYTAAFGCLGSVALGLLIWL